MTINEWKEDFKSFINELQMPRDDYKGIMSYIDEGADLLKDQEPVKPKAWVPKGQTMARVRGYYCPVCDTSVVRGDRFCHWCGRELTWDG